MSNITFSCPKCRMAIECDHSYVGSPIECPGCNTKMTVPNLKPDPPSPPRTSHPKVTGPAVRNPYPKQTSTSPGRKLGMALGSILVVSILIAWFVFGSAQVSSDSSKFRILLGTSVMIAGLITLIVTSLIVCANAFRQSFWWGIGSFVPFIWWRYARKHWDQNKHMVWTNAGAAAVIFCGFGVMGESSIHWDKEDGFSFSGSKGSVTANLAPDETVKTVLNGLANGDVAVAWGALPPSYQTDLNNLIHQYADAVDPKVWNRSFNLAKRFTAALRAKKDYIFNTPMMGDLENKEDTKEQFDQALLLFSTVLNSNLSKQETLKTIDIGEYVNSSGAKLLGTAMTLSGSGKDSVSSSIKDLSKTIVTVANNDGQKATLEITFPGQSKERSDWVKVEGHWVPKALADEWPVIMAEGRQTATMLKNEPEMSAMQANMMFGIFEGMLVKFEQANSQAAFDRALGGLGPLMMNPGFSDASPRSRPLSPEVEDRVLTAKKKYAMAGQPTAQYELGMWYREGRRVEQDYEEAKHWLTLSAEQGYTRAKKALAALEEQLQAQAESDARIEARLSGN